MEVGTEGGEDSRPLPVRGAVWKVSKSCPIAKKSRAVEWGDRPLPPAWSSQHGEAGGQAGARALMTWRGAVAHHFCSAPNPDFHLCVDRI